jgi:Family of unknown function (DUF5694)
MQRFCVLLGALVCAVCAQAQSQSGSKTEILVLGTYHMSNPGRDLHNMQADDVRSAKRQQEIAQLLEVLKKFKPTKIAVESDVSLETASRNYKNYLAGKYELKSDEVDQIGFQLAKQLGHSTIYGVDEEGDFPYGRVMNYAKAHGIFEKLNGLQADVEKVVRQQDDYLHTHTILETLLFMNSDESVKQDVATYFAYVPYGDPDDYAGPDLLAAWYQRNIRIYRNILNLVESPNERILVIYGAGHLGWLQQDAANDTKVRLRKLAEFTGNAK